MALNNENLTINATSCYGNKRNITWCETRFKKDLTCLEATGKGDDILNSGNNFSERRKTNEAKDTGSSSRYTKASPSFSSSDDSDGKEIKD